MSAQDTLPPVTIEHAIGLVPGSMEPFTAKHLNTGISAADAQAYTVKAMPFPNEAEGLYRAASICAFAAAGFGLVSTVLPSVQTGSEPLALLGAALLGVGLLAFAASLAIGAIASRRKRRYAESFKGITDATMTILRTQGQLIALPIVGDNEHGPLVDLMIKDLEEARGSLAATAGDGHALAAGEQKLLTALRDLGAYAKADYDDRRKYEAARDSVREFMGYVVEVAREPKPARSAR